MEKSVTDAINFRRSVRKFDPNKEIDTEIVKKCIENGVLAPTSSNLQLWEFYHITNKDLLRKVSKICFDQPAASTAKQIVITLVRRDLWKKRANQNIDFFDSKKQKLNQKQYDLTKKYYTKAVPLVYNDFLGIYSYCKYLFASTFYALTGFHGLHVTLGTLMILIISWQSRSKGGRITNQNMFPLEAVELYWHFVDGIWVVLFIILYLL